ncbi:hypothetical protein [Alkalilimnicola sp. S0819]|uniref:hypothetical protein n=1 Tax=Alkalilimnicola sp. S0819 TaxID=2613922 RepID=UPI001261D027|nr:hypothetical protein [Alkalilimnicola sp. S0819]KAB7619740.1 hypothetical protein F3N43_12755 [Alkalilimnicola sp. S0819]MPQ17504.1 hypothetical protein [Alkalilimnicola sp. S0819]
MHLWEGKDLDESLRMPRRRDPVHFRTGMLLGPDEHEPQALCWFRDPGELASYLHRIEPQRWGLRGPALLGYKDATGDLCTRIDMLGPEEGLRLELNRCAAPHFAILWWGDLRELLFAPTPWPRRLRRDFLGGSARAIRQEEAPAFVDQLSARYGD